MPFLLTSQLDPTGHVSLEEPRDRLIRMIRIDFHLVLSFYQWEESYSLALSALAAWVRRELPEVRITLIDALEGENPEVYAERISALHPNLLAISAMHPTWLPIVPFLKAVKLLSPTLPILVGGYQPTFSPEETLSLSCVDYICRGDGEVPLTRLIRRLRNPQRDRLPIEGLWEKLPDGEILRTRPALTASFAERPFLDYSIYEGAGNPIRLSHHNAESHRLRTHPVLTGRGCPNRCSYCNNAGLIDLHSRHSKSFLRKYPVDPLVDELVWQKQHYAIDYFRFQDELFHYDPGYSRTFLESYRRRVGLPFSIFSHIRQMDEKFCRYMAECGCHSMWIGIESGSELYRQKYMHRHMTNAQILQAAETAAKFGIRRVVFYMLGMPFETYGQLKESLNLMRRMKAEATIFSQFLPMPGTQLYDQARDAGLLLEPDVRRQVWNVGELNIKEHPDGLTNQELREVVAEIWDFVRIHNRNDDDLTPVENL